MVRSLRGVDFCVSTHWRSFDGFEEAGRGAAQRACSGSWLDLVGWFFLQWTVQRWMWRRWRREEKELPVRYTVCVAHVGDQTNLDGNRAKPHAPGPKRTLTVRCK